MYNFIIVFIGTNKKSLFRIHFSKIWLDTRLYTNWKLEDISIWQNGQEVDSIVLSAFAQSIPSLTSFFQRDEIVPGPGSKRL